MIYRLAGFVLLLQDLRNINPKEVKPLRIKLSGTRLQETAPGVLGAKLTG